MNRAFITDMGIEFAPLVSSGTLATIIIIISALLVLSLFSFRRGMMARLASSVVLIALFLNPSLVEQQKEKATDVAVIVADRSPSQSFGNRNKNTDDALKWLKQSTERLPALETRIIDTGTLDRSSGETRLFEQVDRILSDVPLNRRAGVFFITDGQIHDIPSDARNFSDYGPVSVFLTGSKNEQDRRLVIEQAPSYGIVGQSVTIHYRIEDKSAADNDPIALTLNQDNAAPLTFFAALNQTQTLDVKIPHAGENVFDLKVGATNGELTETNNRVPVIINGVRDRLRVLLVSGQPHAGGRMWRNLLTSDPGVDLVHFTILREPDRIDATPQNELSLIAFPFQELFETKLYDFDLIVFDRYRLNHILPPNYFTNIANYIRDGGALLEAGGPDFAGENSVYETDLAEILPSFPSGQIISGRFTPHITDTGRRHPVTQTLLQSGDDGTQPEWGSWLRMAGISPTRGDILMDGKEKQPLLVLDHVEKGRVAQLASDHVWLWARGFDGGGPHIELLRRLAHWLMKEPDLDENALSVTLKNGRLEIRKRSLSQQPTTVKVTHPQGQEEIVSLQDEKESGWLEASITAQDLGVYKINDGQQERLILAGDFNTPESSNILTSAEHLNPIIRAGKGAEIWLEDTPHPQIRLLPQGRIYGGREWAGLRTNQSYITKGIKIRPLAPPLLYAVLILAILTGGWWLEGRNKKKI